MYQIYASQFGTNTQSKVAYTAVCALLAALTVCATIITADAWLIIRPTGLPAVPFVFGGMALFALATKLCCELATPWTHND